MDNQPRSFFSLLFDLSFSRFVTPSIVRVVFIIAIITAGIGALGILAGFSVGGPQGGSFIFALITALLTFLIWVILARIGLEAVVALFRIAENTNTIARAAERDSRLGE